MATVILVRHGRSTGNTSGVLSGRAAGVHLDDLGREQAAAAGARLSGVPLVSALTSPMTRCRETTDLVLAAHPTPPEPRVVEDLTECDYGAWQGRALSELADEALWRVVQNQPSAAVFPDGESLRHMQHRMVAAVRAHDAEVEREHGPEAVWLLVSHGDPLKSVLADALGTHLDHFQRIRVDPASVSVVRYTGARPFVLATNTRAGDLGWVVPEPAASAGDAVVGGGAGPETSEAETSEAETSEAETSEAATSRAAASRAAGAGS